MFVKERNKIPLPSNNIKVRIALVYPNVYEMGMSSYTIHLLFSLFNNYPGIRCERFFLPKKKDMYVPLKSVDTGSKLEDFDVIAFSIHYELDYMNIMWIMDNLRIPLLEKDRMSKNFPLIIAGGSAVKSNPLILLPFMDALVFGDLEPLFENMCRSFINFSDTNVSFNEIVNEESIQLQELCSLPNFIISRLALQYLSSSKTKECVFPVKRKYLKRLDDSFNPTTQLLPQFQNPEKSLVFGETFLLEINRGCPSGCRFCLTGYANRPFRNRSFTQVKDIIDESITNTRAKKITLIGSAVADHPKFVEICQYIVENKLQLMIPSIRIDRITPEILAILRQGKVKSLTIAPETGTDTLRRKLNKICNSEIIEQCIRIFKHGFQSIKFYFLVGLPFESHDDIQGIVDLIQNIHDNVGKNLPKKGIRLSINPFIPKFFTPYGNYTRQFIDRRMEYFREVEKYLRSELSKIGNVDIEFLNRKEARLQAILSQLDETFDSQMVEFYQNGALPVTMNKLDKKYNSIISNYLTKTSNFFTKSLSSNTPLEDSQSIQEQKLQKLIDMGFVDGYLVNELKNAQKERITGCKDDCHRCGIC